MRLNRIIVNTTNNKLQRIDNGAYETAQVGVEYYSPNQHGGIYGIICRQYHGTKSNGNQIAITGITKLVDFGGLCDSQTAYNGYTNDGTNYIYVNKGVDLVQFNISGLTLNEGWIDYVK